jgi:hypothetical protein
VLRWSAGSALNPALNAFLQLLPDQALDAARKRIGTISGGFAEDPLCDHARSSHWAQPFPTAAQGDRGGAIVDPADYTWWIATHKEK